MPRFDVGLESQPTTTIGSAPAVVDTSSLAVAQLAEAFAGQYLSQQQKQKEQEQKDAASIALAGLQTQVLKLGEAAETGELSLSKANIKGRQRLVEFIVNNPSLSKEAGQLYSATAKTAGLTAGKSDAQLRQEQFVQTRDQMVQQGWVSADATPQQVELMLPSLQKYNRSRQELVDLQKQLTFATGKEALDAGRVRAINEQAKQKAMQSLRSLANAQHSRVIGLVSQWNQQLTDGNRQQIFEQADALKRELLAAMPSVPQSFLSRDEVENIMNTVISPIDILKERADKNMTVKWAQDRIDSTVAISTEDALARKGLLKLHTWSRLVGEATLGRLNQNVEYQNYMGDLHALKGGKGTQDVSKATLQEAVQSAIDSASTKPLTSQDQEILNEGTQNSIEGILQDVVTDDAQGRINKPNDIDHVMKLMSDPAITKKILDGTVALSDNTKQKVTRVVQDEYINKLVPATKDVFTSNLGTAPFEKERVSDIVNLEKVNGVLTVTVKPEAIERREKMRVAESPFFETKEGAKLNAPRDIEKMEKIKDLRNLVANINRSARVMATLNKEQDTSKVLDTLFLGLVGGEEQ